MTDTGRRPPFTAWRECARTIAAFTVLGATTSALGQTASTALSVSPEEAPTRGNIRVEDFLNILPLVFADQASEVSAGATGTGSLNLRGLGAERTLVLIDGRRLPYGSSRNASANLDLIPVQLVERVELLTGGASAAYGADAVGGVANFVLKRDFEGVEFGGQWGTSYNNNDNGFFASVLSAGEQPVPGSQFDGNESQIYTLMGVNAANGRGNLTFFAAYEDRAEIVQADRIFSSCDLSQASGAGSFGGLGCEGSFNFRLFGGPGGFGFQQENGAIDRFIDVPESVRSFNAGAQGFLQRPAERYNVYAKGYYQIADKLGAFENIDVFADVAYADNVSNSQIAPTASFGVGTYMINCDNPLIQGNTGGTETLLDLFGCTPADVAAGTVVDGLTASHRNVEGGARNTRLDNSTWRVISGLRGQLVQHWQWEAFAQFADTTDTRRLNNDFIAARVQQAFLAITDGDGNVVCTDPTDGCVPYNIFQRGPNGESLVTQDALNFIQGGEFVEGSTQQTVFGASLQADLADYGLALPTAAQGVTVMLGVESRSDELRLQADAISRLPGNGFTGADAAVAAVDGELRTTDWFTEATVPLLSDKPFAQELTLRLEYRYSDFEAEGNTTTNAFDASSYGVSLAWAPVDQLHFRASFQQSVRAPNVIELFTAQTAGQTNIGPFGTNNGFPVFDPCATDAPLSTFEECARTGVTAAQYGNIPDLVSGVSQASLGGSPQLMQEDADTITLGLTWAPSFADNLMLSVSYFNIQIAGVVGNPPIPNTIISQCLTTGAPAFCNLITRDEAGSLNPGTANTGFQLTNANVALLDTRGIDFGATYGFDIGQHTINLDYTATMIDELALRPFPDTAELECGSFFGERCGSPSPEYRHRAMATWKTPWRVDIVGTWRHFGETYNDEDNPVDVFEPSLDSVNYFDLAASWRVTEGLLLRGSALNLLGEDPPVFSGTAAPLGNGNTYPTVFDTGTVFVASFQYTF